MGWDWHNTSDLRGQSFTCGYCEHLVSPNTGYSATYQPGGNGYSSIYICPSCGKPTYFDCNSEQTPSVRIGNEVKNIEDEGVKALYAQARDTTSLKAYTATVLLCRKILMNLAVHHGAVAGKSFQEYVDYLDLKGYVPPNGKKWVNHIRTKGNEATHEIRSIEEKEAKHILVFTEMLLKFSYEFPSMFNEMES